MKNILFSLFFFTVFASDSYLFKHEDIEEILPEDTEIVKDTKKLVNKEYTKHVEIVNGMLKEMVDKGYFKKEEMPNLKKILVSIQQKLISFGQAAVDIEKMDIEKMDALSAAIAVMYYHLMRELRSHKDFPADKFVQEFRDMTGFYVDRKYAFTALHFERYLTPSLSPFMHKKGPKFINFFLKYSILEAIFTLPIDQAFNIIFGDKIPSSVTGIPLDEVIKNHPSFWNDFSQYSLRCIKCLLASNGSRSDLEITDDELDKNPKVIWFNDELPTLKAIVLERIKTQNWFTALLPKNQEAIVKLSKPGSPTGPQISNYLFKHTDIEENPADPESLRTEKREAKIKLLESEIAVNDMLEKMVTEGCFKKEEMPNLKNFLDYLEQKRISYSPSRR